ncbi:MAG: hypothetical protein ABIK93_04700 [candidate division WOR-3 bacterium]
MLKIVLNNLNNLNHIDYEPQLSLVALFHLTDSPNADSAFICDIRSIGEALPQNVAAQRKNFSLGFWRFDGNYFESGQDDINGVRKI